MLMWLVLVLWTLHTLNCLLYVLHCSCYILALYVHIFLVLSYRYSMCNLLCYAFLHRFDMLLHLYTSDVCAQILNIWGIDHVVYYLCILLHAQLFLLLLFEFSEPFVLLLEWQVKLLLRNAFCFVCSSLLTARLVLWQVLFLYWTVLLLLSAFSAPVLC